MTCEPYTAVAEVADFDLSDGWRCLNCGELVDAVILGHRQQPQDVWPRPGRHSPASVH
jgi:hypothetical protein